jgi:hypothetical protein
VIREAGCVQGVLSYFELQLAPETTISTDPLKADWTCHWRNALTLVPQPMQVGVGDRLHLKYSYSNSASTFKLEPREAAALKIT